ncbi:MAG: Tm-1-like ATP-binding domain-containing protein [Clostridium sp.]|jgi:uncharacterized protein (UPF0261 family)
MEKTIALIASLDTKMKETMYAAEIIRQNGFKTYVIDISTKTLMKEGADINPVEILERFGISWEDFDPLGKAASIDIMGKAMAKVVPELYSEGKFDAVISIGGGQNAKMAATAMKALPFGVPKIVASSLACGKRTMEQYVGDKDIMVMHTVADISGLNAITKTVIQSVCAAAMGMAAYGKVFETDPGKKVLGTTMLGITTKGTERAIHIIEENSSIEGVVFHANGVGGRCMENLIREKRIDLVLDMNLHEISGEILHCYCSGANNRLLTAIENKIPMVVVPGALDMVDYFVDEQGNGLPDNIDQRKKVYHNSNVCHCKVFKEEAVQLAAVVSERLNRVESPVTLVIPTKGCCEAAAPGGPMYDPEVDEAMVNTFKKNINDHVKLVIVEGNINDQSFSETVAQEVLLLTK